MQAVQLGVAEKAIYVLSEVLMNVDGLVTLPAQVRFSRRVVRLPRGKCLFLPHLHFAITIYVARHHLLAHRR